MEDRLLTHYVGIYSKIRTSIKGRANTSDRSMDDGPSILTKSFLAFSSLFWIISTSSTIKEDVEEEGECEEC